MENEITTYSCTCPEWNQWGKSASTTVGNYLHCGNELITNKEEKQKTLDKSNDMEKEHAEFRLKFKIGIAAVTSLI